MSLRGGGGGSVGVGVLEFSNNAWVWNGDDMVVHGVKET